VLRITLRDGRSFSVDGRLPIVPSVVAIVAKSKLSSSYVGLVVSAMAAAASASAERSGVRWHGRASALKRVVLAAVSVYVYS